MANFLSLWVPGYLLLVPSCFWISSPFLTHKQFLKLKNALLSALALHLPDLCRPFHFYTSETQSYALGVLGHFLGPSFAPVYYLSKILDNTTLSSAGPLAYLPLSQPYLSLNPKTNSGSHFTIYSHLSLNSLLIKDSSSSHHLEFCPSKRLPMKIHHSHFLPVLHLTHPHLSICPNISQTLFIFVMRCLKSSDLLPIPLIYKKVL